MKKKHLFISLISFLLLSCGKSSSYSFKNIDYPVGGISNYLEDEDMLVDGLGNESHYEGLEELEIYEPLNKVTLKSKVYLGVHGMYFYNYVDDHSVFYSDELQIYANDGVEMHINVDPDYSISLAGLKRANRVTDDMLQIRTDVSGRLQTWVGNGLPRGYEWTQYHKDCKIAVHVDGRINRADAAEGYSIEMYVPYSSFGLHEAPNKISFMPAFNNSSSNLDSERRWYAMKGMSHNYPSSWMVVDKNGFLYPGKEVEADAEIKADRNDERYLNKKGVFLKEVDENNQNPVNRGEFKAYLGHDGVYVQAKGYDKEISRYNDSVWANDGIEFYIDTLHNGDGIFHTGEHRLALDIDNGFQSDSFVEGFDDSYPFKIKAQHNVSILEINTYSRYGYNYLYCFELFIPFAALNITRARASLGLYIAFALSSPLESTYILDRKNGIGEMEPSSWLWIDRHYPKNASEYYRVSERGLV